jgi:uncharacterized protein YqgC (DUF456 family)
MTSEIVLIILSFILVLAGLLGVILPFLPGVGIAWLGLLLFAYTTGFSVITLKIVLIFLSLSIGTFLLDLVAPLLGAKKYKASNFGILGSFLGFIFGVMLFGPVGILIGPFVGAFLGERFSGRKPEEAAQSAKGTFVGFLVGSLIKISLILAMLGFLISALI